MQGGDPLGDVGARGVDDPDDGQARGDRLVDESHQRLALDGADGAVVLATLEAKPGDAAVAEAPEPGVDRAAALGGERQGQDDTTSVALWPPKPNEFDRAIVRSIVRGSPYTTSTVISGSVRW